MAHTLIGNKLQAFLNCMIQRRTDANIEATADEREAERFASVESDSK